MGNSLTEQLLKAGLVDENKARHVEKAKHKQKRKTKGGGKQPHSAGDSAAVDAQRARAAQAERERALNARRKEEAEQRERAAQVRQMVESQRVEVDGETRFNFADGAVIRHLDVDAATARKLARGALGVARRGTGYAIVPASAAEKIAERDASQLVLLNRPEDGQTEDEAYAEHPIPDDLMW